MATTVLWTVFGPEWEATIQALRTADNELADWIREEMEEAIRPAADRAKAKVMTVGVIGGPEGHTGMRARVAQGVGVRVGPYRHRNGAYFRVFTSMKEEDEWIIPRGLDRARGWRHPLFGDKRYWYTSRPTFTGWFTDTIADSRDEIARNIQDALERAAELIDAAS
ncbi:hypothetical protein ACFY7C_19660 [Streptomyces sp. NPDC012769]|uniref:hypothetical protein n=1 Tax=Streptomyces sp. NPDC012769 TaxID=3364848 RepID=UPI00368293BE